MHHRYKHNKTMIDIHAHILPGADDGARTMQESMALIKMSVDAGFSTVIVTPHYSESCSSEKLLESIHNLQQEVYKHYSEFKLYFGQEILYHDALSEKIRRGEAFTINHSRYVLVEFRADVSFVYLKKAIRELNRNGYVPILAHLERYHCLRQEHHLKEIYKDGCLLQMNYESISGKWFQKNTRWCRRVIKDGMIHFLATDMHRLESRTPEIKKALQWLSCNIDLDYYERITYKNAEYIINNKDLGWIKNE